MDYTNRGDLQQLFVDSLADYALILLDVDGKVLTWNAGAHAMLGYAEIEAVGRHFSYLYSQNDIDAGKPLMSLAGALAQGRHEEISQWRRKDGTELKAQNVLTPLYDPLKKLVAFGNLAREIDRPSRSVPVKPVSVVAAGGGKKVLLVDDDEAVRGTAVSLLESLGYQVVVASGGAEALDIIARDSSIDVLFTDVVMPGGMNGGEVAKEALRLRPDVKVLFSSGYFEGALVREGDIAASTHFIVKPYRKKDLAQKMDEVLNSRMAAA
jgi:PAS domain S-box-containing protein